MRCFIMALLLAAGAAWAGDPQATPEVKLGTKIASLEFKDIRYLPRTLDDLGKPKAYVLTFITNTCPVAQRYVPRLIELDKEFAPLGVQFVAINAAPEDSITEMAYHAIEFGIPFPVVKDTTGACAKALGATRTPQAILLDADRVMRYRGRVDDQYRLGGVKPVIGRSDLKEAIQEVLAGKEVSVGETPADGCAITFQVEPEPAETITYTKHVAPVMNKHCVTCHRENGGAPFPLTDYKSVSARAKMIAEVVSEGRMPPWYAHPQFGTFFNERKVSNEERRHVRQWLAGGKAEGNPADLPEAPVFSYSEWITSPDVIIEAKSNNGIPAEGFIPYKYIMFPYEFQHDTWIQGIEIKPTNPNVVHHANLFYTTGGMKFKRAENFLTGYVPGGSPAYLTDGQALFIPAGATIGLQIHYVTTGKMEVDKPRVGLRFAKEPVRKRVYYKILDDPRFVIPPFASAHRTYTKERLDRDASLVALFSHMHLRGKDMTFNALYPDGTKETLLSIPNFNFDWQLVYGFETGKKTVPAGTEIECIAHFDNSAFNPYNPDPTTEVTYGDQTVDEMSQGFMFYTYNDENLDIKVDPKTGWELTAVSSNP